MEEEQEIRKGTFEKPLRWSEIQQEGKMQLNPMVAKEVARGSLVGKPMDLGGVDDSTAPPSSVDDSGPTLTPLEISKDNPSEDGAEKQLPADGLQKITRIQSYFLFNDDTDSVLTPIEWAASRKPYISKLRLLNGSSTCASLSTLAIASCLVHIGERSIGSWMLAVSLVDLFACFTCEIGARRVYIDIKRFAHNTKGRKRVMRSHEDVPQDTIGQSILEAFWWMTLFQLLHHLAVSTYIFSYPPEEGPLARQLGVAGGSVGLLLAALHALGLWVTIKVTTWYEIVQGFVEHVNAFGVVCALMTVGCAVKVLEYDAGLPEQASTTPSMTSIWVLFAVALSCVPLSVVGFFAAWNEHRRMLRVYGALAALTAAAFLVLLVYLGAVVDYADILARDSKSCKKVLTFVHQDWWARRDFVGCEKYVGDAQQWKPSSSSFEVTGSGVGILASLSCDTKKDDVYAWEANDGCNASPAGDSCLDYYGCLNRDCCDDLVEALEKTKFIQLLVVFTTSVVVACSATAAIFMAKKVSRDRNESILSHLGAQATLAFIVLAIIVGTIVIAVGAANAGGGTTSDTNGLGDKSSDFNAADNATGVLPDSVIIDDSGKTSDNGKAILRFNDTCLTTAYKVYREEQVDAALAAGVPTPPPLMYVAEPLLLPPCTSTCAAWISEPPSAACASAAARRENPTLTCVFPGNGSCFTANLENGSCQQPGRDVAVACAAPPYDDLAVTSGACKSYVNALQIILPSDLQAPAADVDQQGREALGCTLEASFVVTHGGSVKIESCFTDDGSSLSQCNDTSGNDGSHHITVTGSAEAVAAAVANITFCPECVEKDYHVVFRIKSLNTSVCSVNGNDNTNSDQVLQNFTIRAATNLIQRFNGFVVDGTCLSKSGEGTECWDGSHAIEGAAVTANLPCFNYSTTSTAGGGEFTLHLPYRGSDHNMEVPLTVSATGFESAKTVQTLGATRLGNDRARYGWKMAAAAVITTYGQHQGIGGGGGQLGTVRPWNISTGYCVDLTTASWVSAKFCAGAGVDTCRIYAGLFPNSTGEDPRSSSECDCSSGGATDDDGPYCTYSESSFVCPGCAKDTSGPCQAVDGTCYFPHQDGTCGEEDSEWCDDGWPCGCEYGLTENVHALGPQMLFPVPTPEPTAGPSISPTFNPSGHPSLRPTLGPTTEPSPAPTLEPTESPTPEPSTLEPTLAPTTGPSITPTTEPSPLPISNPTSLPTTPPTTAPSVEPSVTPSPLPTTRPSPSPSLDPSFLPTALPTPQPSAKPAPAPSTTPTSSPSGMPSTLPVPSPSMTPSEKPSPTPTLSFVTIGGVVVDARTKSIGIDATVKCENFARGTIVNSVVDGNTGTFSFAKLPQGTYTLTVEPTNSIYHNPYTRTVVASTESAAGSTRLVIPLAEKLVPSQVMIVVEWGPARTPTTATATTTPASLTHGANVGVATDVDAYLRFSVAGGRAEGREGRPSRRGSQQPYVNPQTAASCSHHQKCDSLGLEGVCCPTLDGIYLDCCEARRKREDCLVFYNSPDCGGAHLVTNGGDGDAIQLDAVDDDNDSEQALSPRRAACALNPACAELGLADMCCPTAGGVILDCCDESITPEAASEIIAASGVEVLFLDPILETSYTLYVRNVNLDHPLDSSGIRVNIYSSEGPIGKAIQPPPICSNATHGLKSGSKDSSAACRYHDTPLLPRVQCHVPQYGQCGGIDAEGTPWPANLQCCPDGFYCSFDTQYYSQCLMSPSDANCSAAYEQCGGLDFIGTTCCTTGYECTTDNEYFSGCTPIPVAPPFWGSSTENLAAAEFLRVACLEYTEATLVAHECQRYMSSAAFSRLSLTDECPPVDDDTCTSRFDQYSESYAGSNDDAFWFCSRNVANGIFQCPGGSETMIFCPSKDDQVITCSEPAAGPLSAMVEDPIPDMCRDMKKEPSRRPRVPPPVRE